MEVKYAAKNITLNLPLLVVATTAFVLVCCDILVHWKHWQRPWEISCWNCFLEKKSHRTLLVRMILEKIPYETFLMNLKCLVWRNHFFLMYQVTVIRKKWHFDSIISSSKH